VAADGESIELESVDAADTPVTLQFPFLQAEAVAMTLPHLADAQSRLISMAIELS
jgi:hypothetical protein